MSSSIPKNKIKIKKKHIKHVGRISFWFFTGAFIGLLLIVSFSYLGFQSLHKDKVYPGVTINGQNFGSKSQEEVRDYFKKLNEDAANANFMFSFEENTATLSAKDIDFGYDENLLTDQAMSVGRSDDPLSNISIILQAYTNGVELSPSYKFSEQKLNEKLKPLYEKIDKKPVEALFNFENGRVTAFKASENGREVNKDELNQLVLSKARLVLNNTDQKTVIISVPTKTVKPNLTTDKVNKMGITELIGEGNSTFKGSIENRVYNIGLASSRLNGVLVKPGETFSFNKTIGDVSSLTGYKQAYVISGGRTILGDGGGVCQVSTTFFRAVLNAGLPIVERNPHAYRVSYYEQDSGPGVDAAIYTPNVDFRFKNDTDHHILIQSIFDPVNQKLTFMLYGTSDGRVSTISEPVVLSQTPAPEPKFEDDPNLPAGQVKQIDFAAAGAKVYFTRTVTKNGETIIDETFNTTYRPWQAVFVRGTKQ